LLIITLLLLCTFLLAIVIVLQLRRPADQQRQQQSTEQQLTILNEKLSQLFQYQEQVQKRLQQHDEEQRERRQKFDEHQLKSLTQQQQTLQQAMSDVRQQITITLNQHTKQLNERVEKLTAETQNKLSHISQEVDKQLTKGFEKTTSTFTDIVKRLTIIDQAQKKISELSGNVINLQNVLEDKRSRGAFGEVQLMNLISNMLPSNHYASQYTLSNNKRADCILFLPKPTGNIVVDAKFPLENYRHLIEENASAPERKIAEQNFKQDIKKHINDIASKYIIANETADGAVMFIPAEAVFAQIHSGYPELVQLAQQKKVWLVSPTTMMAVLTTASAVLKDEATRKQVHIIREHLISLSKDFDRFQKRMDNLARHIDQAQQDVVQVHKSSQKISSRFNKIEAVELDKTTSEENLSTATQSIKEEV
jgi:DNA recombination protein RmuC